MSIVQEKFTLSKDLDCLQVPQKDDFEAVYANQAWNWTLVCFYLLGIGSCIGLLMVCWFEQSGLAGPYRTVTNQLVTRSLYQVRY